MKKSGSSWRAAVKSRSLAEPLERRMLLAIVHWSGAAGDNLWSSPGNWGGSAVPGASDEVVIDSGFAAIQYTAAVPAANRAVGSLEASSPLNFSGTSFAVQTTATMNAPVTLAGGTIAGGTWDVTGTPSGGITCTSTGGSISDTTISGDVNLASGSARVSISGATRFGNARLLTVNSYLYFSPGYTLHDTVVAEGSASGQILMTAPGTLTVAATGVIRVAAGSTSELRISDDSTMTLVNNGLITCDAASRVLRISSGTLTNHGTMRTTAPGNLELNSTSWSNFGTIAGSPGALVWFTGDWSDSGHISIDNATLRLAGTFSPSDINYAGFTRIGGTVNLSGTLANTGATLVLNSVTGTWNLDGGGIIGGTVELAEGQLLLPTFQGGTLNNVQINGDLVLSSTSARLDILGETRFTSARLQASGATLRFFPDYTLHDTIVVEGSPSGLRRISQVNDEFRTLTVGPTGVIRIAPGTLGNLSVTGNALVNNGLISCDGAGRSLDIQLGTFTNNNTLMATAGKVSIFASAIGVANYNSSTNTLTGGVWSFNNASFVWSAATIRTIAASTSVLLGGSGTHAPFSQLTANNGNLTVDAGRVLTVIPHSGTFTNNGSLTLKPGSRLDVLASFAQTSAGSLEIGIASASVFGSITATGTVTLDGGLVITYTGYNLTRGDSFDLVTGSSVSGDFVTTSIGGVQGYERPWLRYEGGRVRLEVLGAADFDGDGFITGLDYDLYVYAFEAGDAFTDLDGDGFVTGLDFDLFVQAFEHG